MSDFPTDDCRSCKKPIIWTKTEGAKDMPVDAEPAKGANLAVFRDSLGAVRSKVVAPHLAFGRRNLRFSHFVNCPHAEKWRRKP